MTMERDKTLEALKTAIQMEIDGKKCYLEASKASNNELGKKLLKSMAAEEDIHRKKFKEIYDAISSKKGWPKFDFKPNRGQKLRTLFAGTCEIVGTDVEAVDTEMGAIETALKKESESYDFYTEQSKSASFAAEKEFYDTIAAEEHEHSLILVDYREYLKNPAGWFVMKERHSLDGG